MTMIPQVTAGLRRAALALRLAVWLLLPLTAQADPSPANDNFANAVVIGGSLETNVVLSASNVGATFEPGESFHAAHIVGYFDTIEDMHKLNDRYKGHTELTADAACGVFL